MTQTREMIPNPNPTKAEIRDAKITALRQFKAGKIDLEECLDIIEYLAQHKRSPPATNSLSELAREDDAGAYVARRRESWRKGRG